MRIQGDPQKGCSSYRKEKGGEEKAKGRDWKGGTRMRDGSGGMMGEQEEEGNTPLCRCACSSRLDGSPAISPHRR